MKRLLLCCLVFVLGIYRGFSYNLEEKLPLFKYGDKGSKFGYSVALHTLSTDDSGGEINTLLVAGAPRANYALGDIAVESRPQSPGGLYSCPLTTSHSDCTRTAMDKGGNYNEVNNIKSGPNITYTKDDQWLGVSVKSQGPGKFVMTCAHRFRQVVNSGSADDEEERMCGKCFLLKAQNNALVEILPDSDELPRKFVSSPCDVYKTGKSEFSHKNRYGVMQAGTSIDITENDYIYGAPGTWAWTGALFDFSFPIGDNDQSESYETPECYRDGSRVTSESGIWNCKKYPVPRDSYIGISVATSASVDTDEDTLYYAAGAPRASHTGAVVFFKRGAAGAKPPSPLLPDTNKTIFGDRVHSSFGYSVALTDINGDGLDDLIVGAPQYYEISHKRKAGGAVYIYLNKDKKDFSTMDPHVILYGQLKSYFGHSIAVLGDIDQDGFNDFAVGAPYEGDSGVVHIYRGGEKEFTKSQVIQGSDYEFVNGEFQPLVGFGSSLSGNVDADGNNYPDLLIGSLSDTIALFRSRPIISVIGELDVGMDELDLNVKNCRLRGIGRWCFNITYCLSFTARQVQYDKVPIKYKVVLDSLSEGEPRLFSVQPIEGSVTITEGVRICPGNRQTVYFDGDYVDKLTDIEITFEFELDNPPVQREEEGDPIFKMINDPILDRDLDNVLKKRVRIKNTCGDDGCQSNLILHAAMNHEVYIGEDATTTLTLNVANLGEEAHQAYLEIYLPRDVRYDKSEIVNPSLPEMRCYSGHQGAYTHVHDVIRGFETTGFSRSESISVIKCNLGNPYRHGMSDTIVITLSTEGLDQDTKMIDVLVLGHTSSENPKILPIELQAIVLVEVDLTFRGFGYPQQVRYQLRPIIGEMAVRKPGDIGETLVYNYEIANSGLYPVDGISINVQLPIEIFNGKWLLYPFDASVTTGSEITAGTCNSTNINILKIDGDISASAVVARNRNKRSIEKLPPQEAPVAQASSTNAEQYRSKLVLKCGESRCINITCKLDELDIGTTTLLALQVHLWEATFLEEYKAVDLINILSSATVETENKHIRFKDGNLVAHIQTTVDHGKLSEDISYHFPWWYILIGIIIMLLIYIVIIILLVRCGFFKRKRFPRGQRESLYGDEKRVEEEEEDEM